MTDPHVIAAPRPRGGRLAAVGTIIATMALLLVSLVAVPANAAEVGAQAETGGITGTISLPVGDSVDDANLTVSAEDDNENEYDGDVDSSAGNTTTYSFTGLADGNYTVYFRNGSQEYKGASLDVTVASGAVTTGQDVTLQVLPTSVTGTITLGGGIPFSSTSLNVYAYNDDDYEVYGSITPTSGSTATYSIKGLGAGTYTVYFSDDNKEYAPAELSGVVVNSVGTTTGQNVTLVPAARMSGSIQPSGGGALDSGSEINVRLSNDDDTFSTWVDPSETTYEIRGITAGTYTLRIIDEAGVYQNQTASGVVVTAGAALTRNITMRLVNEPAPAPAPPPPPVVPTAQSVAGGVTKKVKAKKNKKISIPSRTNAGVTLKWKSTTSKVCKIKGKTVQLTGKRGACKLVAKAGATPAFFALTKNYNIKVK